MPNKKQIPLNEITNQNCDQVKKLCRHCTVRIKNHAKIMNGCTSKHGDLKRKCDPSGRCNDSPKKSVSVDENSVEKLVKKYELLQRVISKKYVTVVERLKLDYVPVCAENLEYCHSRHYKTAPLPKLPSKSQMNLVQNSLQQARYTVFINLVWSLCRRGQFPGDVVLTNIVKLLLTLNPESKHNNFLQPILDQLLWLFDVILRLFPPCWLALRPSYMKFLRNTIEMSKLLPNNTYKAEMTIFELALMLLEDTIEDRDSHTRNNRSSRRNQSSTTSLTDFADEYFNMQHWEKCDNEEQTFTALSKATRLDRLMQVLHLIAKMLEMDLVMWMLRYHKHPSKHVYGDEDQPLVITLFSLSKYTRSSVLVKKAMTLFAVCVGKNLQEEYLKVLERFISLLANVQNACEIETTSAGISYPVFGSVTKSFALDLFKICESNIKKEVATYLRLIRTLRCPFLRYEYADLFLKRLNPDAGKMCPQKIVENFRKKRWLQCESDQAFAESANKSLSKKSIVYRRDYLAILLDALRNYCDFHGTKDFLNMKDSQKNADKSSENPQRPLSHVNNNEVDLSELTKNIAALEKNLDMSMKLRDPRPKIPLVNIRVNSELYSEYRNDIKYVMILHAYIPALQEQNTDDFSEFIDFLKDFAPKY